MAGTSLGPIEVKYRASTDVRAAVFSSPFRIGRGTDCEVCIPDAYVSRVHARVTPEASGWKVADLNSSNGIYWCGSRVESVLVTHSEVVRLGVEGPELLFHVQEAPRAAIPSWDKGAQQDWPRPAPAQQPTAPPAKWASSGPLPPPASTSKDWKSAGQERSEPALQQTPAAAPSKWPDTGLGQRPVAPPTDRKAAAQERPGPAAPPAKIHVESAYKPGAPPEKMEEVVKRYFRAPVEGEVVGEHTGIIRLAYAEVQKEQKRTHTRQKRILLGAIGGLALIGVLIAAYALRLRSEANKQRELARNLFYSMKSLDVEIAAAEQTALTADKAHGLAVVNAYESRRKEMQKNYDQFLATLHIYSPKDTEQHRLILRVARIFGESELDMPPDFENEVLRYIRMWQSTGRFARDIQTAAERGYTRSIPEAFLNRGLPPQFFYLAMQESDFDPYRTGPMTRKGYAKGMWQFIPETAVAYGLHLGPLVDLNRPDPGDERDQAEKATDAATRYIQLLYSTDAQASGLLVMACYNWGENQVLPLVRSMPLNPRERNFWRLLAEHRSQIPPETYNYVFYIFSAAVIGENPRLFGFPFDNPLENPAQVALLPKELPKPVFPRFIAPPAQQ